MSNINKTSILIPSQLPSYISEDVNYEKFVAFIKAYYEWMEQSGIVISTNIINGGLGYTNPVVTINGDGTGATAKATINGRGCIEEIIITSYGSGYTHANVSITGTNLIPATATVNLQNGVIHDSKNLLSYMDVDTTTEKFLDYFVNEFIPYFPADALVTKDKAVKFARELYTTKGTPASYELLFRMLYNSSFDYYNTGDLVLKASAGNWFVPKSLSLLTTDERFLKTTNYRLFGETTKSFAVIENAILAEEKIEIFISEIDRLFQSGEYVRVVDNNNQDVIVNGTNLRAKIVGQISSIDVDPNFKGLKYNTGDPVVIYGGLNDTVVNPVGASAVVGDIVTGSIQHISLLTKGHGYNLTRTSLPSSQINFTTKQSVGYTLPSAAVTAVDTSNAYTITGINTDTIGYKYNISLGANNFHFANAVTSNINSKIENVLSTTSFTGYPIESVFLLSSGGGLTVIPDSSVVSEYATDNPATYAIIGDLGILGPIKIANGGHGYRANDTINFTGGSGFGAKAKVANVDSNGAITQVSFYSANNVAMGGMGYKLDLLPALSVTSANTQAANAVLYVDTILGQGATLDLVTSQIGQITNINLINPGEDYISTPSVSLRVQDIAIKGVTTSTIPQAFDVVYQGVSQKEASYSATIYQVTQIGPTTIDPRDTIYRLRVFNYTGDPNVSVPLVSVATGSQYYATGQAFDSTWNSQGIINYGDGTAVGYAKFLNGLRIGQGQYLSSSGQLSSFDVIQSEDYNSFTYQITTQKEIAKYRSVLLNMLHPTGTKLLGRYSITNKDNFNFATQSSQNKANTLYHYTQTAASYASMYADLNTTYSDKISFGNLAQGTNIAEFIFANSSTIAIKTTFGPNVISMVTNVDYANNQITVAEKTFLTFANTFYAEFEGDGQKFQVTSSMGNYKFGDAFGLNIGPDNEFVTGLQQYYNTETIPLMGMLFPGDYVYLPENPRKQVQYVDYANSTVYITSPLKSNSGIYSVEILDGGSGYDYNTLAINIIGDGTGANVVPVLDTLGRIVDVKVVETGYGYNSATAQIGTHVPGGPNYHTPATLGGVQRKPVTSNSAMTIVKNVVAGGSFSNMDQVKIYGPAGQQYFPELTDENGNVLITEDGQIILLG